MSEQPEQMDRQRAHSHEPSANQDARQSGSRPPSGRTDRVLHGDRGSTWPVPRLQPIVFLVMALCFTLISLDHSELIPSIHIWVIALYEWFLILSAFSILLGVINVFYSHLVRIAVGQTEWGYSLALVAVGLATLVAGLIQPAGVTSPTVEWIFDALLAPGQATLYALIIFFMVAAAFRFLRVTTPGGGWMLAGVLFMLIVQMPASSTFLPPSVGETMRWLLDVPIMATFRGALLGSALGLFIVGVRHLLGRTQL